MSEAQDYWNARAAQYGIHSVGYGARPVYDKVTLEAFDKILDCSVLLDVGCGSGRLYETLSRHCERYVGVDFSAEMLKLFVQNHSLRDQDSLQFADIAKLPFADSTFDAVVTNVVLQHVTDNKKFLAVVSEIKRVLKSEGMIYVCEAMSQGIVVRQTVSYQRIRPIEMYRAVFEPEILLEDKGAPYLSHHFLIGQRKILKIDESQIAVDIGSGRSKVYGTIGVDRRIIYRHGVRKTDIIADARFLPFPDSSIDELWCCNLLEHFKNPYIPLLEIHRVIKPEGKVIIEVPYSGTQSADGDPTHKFVPGPDTWANILAGFFEKVNVQPMGLRFCGNTKWREWQRKLVTLGFYDLVQGGRFTCAKPQEIPEFRYIPWWLEEYVKSVVGEDLV